MSVTSQLSIWFEALDHSDNEFDLIESWFRIPPILFRELATLIQISDPEPLCRMVERGSRPNVKDFLRYLCKDSGRFRQQPSADFPDDEKLSKEFQDILHAAQVVHAAIHLDAAALQNALKLAANLTIEEMKSIETIPSGASPEARLQTLWRKIRPLRPGSRGLNEAYTNALVNAWRSLQTTATPFPLEKYPRITASRNSSVLIYQSNGTGAVAWLHADLLADGAGECYLDPEAMTLCPLSNSFIEGSNRAWFLARQTATSLYGSSASIGYRDIRWRIESNQIKGRTLLEGGSHGAALTVVLTQLLTGQPLDASIAVTASITETGSFGPVFGVREKAIAAFDLKDSQGYPVISRLAVHPQNFEEACNVARIAGRDAQEAVAACRTLSEYLPDANNLFNQFRQLLHGETRWVLNDSCQRMQRNISDVKHFFSFLVPMNVMGNPNAKEDLSNHQNQSSGFRSYRWEDIRPRISRDLICGAAGQGKTALLWQEVIYRCQKALSLVQSQSQGAHNANFAIFVRSAELAEAMPSNSSDTFLQTIGSLLVARHGLKQAFKPFLIEKIKRGDCMIALDALEETPRERMETLFNSLTEFATSYPMARFIIASRHEGALFDPLPVARANRWEMQPYDETQVRMAALPWFPNRPDLAGEFINRIAIRQNLKHILLSPLLLRIACSLALDHWNRSGELPEWSRRVDLYDSFLRDMTLEWSRRAPLPSVGQQTLFLAFASEVALSLLKPASGLSSIGIGAISEIVNEVQRNFPVMAGRALLDDLCGSGILNYSGSDARNSVVTFTHRTFGEYLAATALARRIKDRGFAAIEKEIETYIDDEASKEIVVFLAGMLSDPLPLLQCLSDATRDDIFRHRLALACVCLVEVT